MRRELCSFLIIAILNFITGCYSLETIKPEYLRENPDIAVKEVVLSDDRMIEFNDARYVIVPPFINGNLKSGKSFKQPLAEIIELKISNSGPIDFQQIKNRNLIGVILKDNSLITFNKNWGVYNQVKNVVQGTSTKGKNKTIAIDEIQGIIADPQGSLDSSVSLLPDGMKITEAVTKGKTYTFDEQGAQVIAAKEYITGISLSNNLISLNPDSILYVNALTPSDGTTLLLVLGIAAVVYVIVVAVSISNWHWGDSWGDGKF